MFSIVNSSGFFFFVQLNTYLSYPDVFMAVEEVNEAKEEVALEPEASTSPLPTVPEEFQSCKFFLLVRESCP